MGIDEAHGRFGEVSLQTCLRCGEVWLHYQMEIEGISHSGRWYRCLLKKNTLETLTPKNALSHLKNTPEHLYGGSYFNSTGEKRKGPLLGI